ncbi:DNA-directed RNA polymerase V subunit 7 isoform X2 [Amborella trichopoda]|uniref:DNA-directed RNA polymerase V subunit 7 isoform X2 n=1 Tax=Amborella trichopoda TaxID=13333 RepID=UPI0005D38D3D|nr:DNA-directed RNA polymerase V subunit 7 isoform X2 [Amborella trichopoda]|eukprot:XP_011621595.1 DNA-directed RNA polymerase V subunit 7 isoform X2 [Amborella trichopoda]
MFLEIEMKSNVVVPPDQLYQNLLLHRSIILKLLEDVAHIKATQKHGYLVAVTSLKERGEGKVFLSLKKMEDFKYVHGENPIFVNDKNLKLERHGVVRFRVLALQWMEGQREFMLLASLEGDFLGPVSGMENSGLASSKCL